MGLRGPKPGAKVERDVAIIRYYCALRRKYHEPRHPHRPGRTRRSGYTQEEALELTAAEFHPLSEESIRAIMKAPFDSPAWRQALPLVISDRIDCYKEPRPVLMGRGRRPRRAITDLIEAARDEASAIEAEIEAVRAEVEAVRAVASAIADKRPRREIAAMIEAVISAIPKKRSIGSADWVDPEPPLPVE